LVLASDYEEATFQYPVPDDWADLTQGNATALDVRFWHLADIPAAPTVVHYWSNSGQLWAEDL